MPELPEVETIRKSLNSYLTGARIADFRLFWPRTLEASALHEFRRHVVQQRIATVGRRAKYVVLVLDSADRITIHLRMTGELLLIPKTHARSDDDRERYLRAEFALDNEYHLRFYDVRKFGRIRLVAADDWDEFDCYLGIEPLSDEFTFGAFYDLLHARKRQTKPLLLDQSLLAGLGNIYVDESLFRARIHPLQRSDTLTCEQIKDLHRSILEVISQALENRGTTFQNYRTGLGQSGDNQNNLLVYGSRTGNPCPRCCTPLERMVVGQRGTIICPHCQRLSSSGVSQ